MVFSLCLLTRLPTFHSLSLAMPTPPLILFLPRPTFIHPSLRLLCTFGCWLIIPIVFFFPWEIRAPICPCSRGSLTAPQLCTVGLLAGLDPACPPKTHTLAQCAPVGVGEAKATAGLTNAHRKQPRFLRSCPNFCDTILASG